MRHIRVSAIVLLVAGCAVGGCQNAIEPYSHRGVYSVYGALSLTQGHLRQFVRVKPLDQPISSVPRDPLSATVTLENVSTGERHTLVDSVIVFGDETVTHNFTTLVDVEPRTEYRLTVQRSDGAATQATTVTPTTTEASIDPSGFTPAPPTDTVTVDSDSLHCLDRFTVRIRDAKFPLAASVGLTYNGQKIWVPQTHKIGELPGDADKGFEFTPRRIIKRFAEGDFDDIRTCRYREHPCRNMDTGRIEIAYTYVGPQWYGERPEHTDSVGFDPSQTAQVAGGLGFFGSYFRDTLAVAISRGVVDLGPDVKCPPLSERSVSTAARNPESTRQNGATIHPQ